MANLRHQAILHLIQIRNIATQDELREALKTEGFDVTQATISRDIRQLKLRKVRAAGGGSKYARGGTGTTDSGLLRNIVISVDYAGNTVVLRCQSGSAPAAAAVLDNMLLPNILGSIAGDDTIFLLARTEESAKHLTETLCVQIWN